jgi:hypothetical protein
MPNELWWGGGRDAGKIQLSHNYNDPEIMNTLIIQEVEEGDGINIMNYKFYSR